MRNKRNPMISVRQTGQIYFAGNKYRVFFHFKKPERK
jgi:hypothetical protein